MIRKTFTTAFVASSCALGVSFAVPALAQEHGGAAKHGEAPAGEKHGEEHGSGHEGGHEGSGHEGGHGGHHGPAPMNFTDFSNKETPPYVALLVNFGILAFAYYSLGKKPVAEALKQRKEDIGKEIEEAQKLLADAKERSKKHQKDLKNVAEDTKTAREALQEAGEGERDRIVREAEEKAARVGRDAGFLVEQEAKQLRLDLTREAVEQAVVKAEAMLRAAVTQADHERLAEEFLAELGTKSTSSTGGAS